MKSATASHQGHYSSCLFILCKHKAHVFGTIVTQLTQVKPVIHTDTENEEHRAEVCPLPTAEHGSVCVSEASSCGPASARRYVHPFASECLTSRQERREELIRHGLIRHVQLDDAISDWRFFFFPITRRPMS